MAHSYMCQACKVAYFSLLPKNCRVLHVKVSATTETQLEAWSLFLSCCVA